MSMQNPHQNSDRYRSLASSVAGHTR